LVLLHDFLIYILLLIASLQDLEQCMDYFNNIRGSESFWYSVLYTFLTTVISGAFFVGLRVTRRRLVVEYTVEEERRGGPETYQALLAVPGEREPEKELSPSKRGESREIGIQVEPEESWEDTIDYAEQGTQTIRTHYLEKDEYTQTDSIAVRAVKVGTDPVQIRPAGVQTVLSHQDLDGSSTQTQTDISAAWSATTHTQTDASTWLSESQSVSTQTHQQAVRWERIYVQLRRHSFLRRLRSQIGDYLEGFDALYRR
jgi:hypothetical protein